MLTDEQINIALESLKVGYWDVPMGSTEEFARAIEAEVRKEIDAAVLAERESCAFLVASQSRGSFYMGDECRNMIRACSKKILDRAQNMSIDDAHKEAT